MCEDTTATTGDENESNEAPPAPSMIPRELLAVFVAAWEVDGR